MKEEMNTRGKEDENVTFKRSLKFRNIGNYVGMFVVNQYLRIKNWKFNPILKLKDESLR